MSGSTGPTGSTPPAKPKKKRKRTKKKLTPALTKTVASRVSKRVKAKYDRTAMPKLTLESSYIGVATQKLDAVQNIYFSQTATLKMTTKSVKDISHYYELRQLVRDTHTSKNILEGKDYTEALAPTSVQDEHYEPPYSDDQTDATKEAIEFTDEPGFAKSSAVEAKKWLSSYAVYFKWTVTDTATRQVWTSPEVSHTVTCVYDAGKDVAVAAVPAGDRSWDVVLDPRTRD